jgi:hypothetical protein
VAATAAVLSVLVGLIDSQCAEAATVYRCGPDFTQYSQMPCEGGRELDVTDSRDAEQVRQGQDAARHHARAERNLARDLRELEQHPPAAGNLSPRHASAQTKAAPTSTANKRRENGRKEGTEALPPDSFKAMAPAPAGTKKRPTKSALKSQSGSN